MSRWTALAVALVTTSLLAGTATGDPGSEKARIDARIGDLESRALEAARTEGVLTTDLSHVAARVRGAEAVVATEQAELTELEALLSSERVRLAALEEEIRVQTARLVVLEQQYAKALAVLEQHLRAIYESDTPDLIALALGTTSYSDLVDNIEMMNRIGSQDAQIASSLERVQTELGQARAATNRARQSAARSEALIASRVEAQRLVRDRMVANRNDLAAAEQEKARALASTREDRATFVAEAESLAAQSAALGAQIAAAQRASTSSPPAGAEGSSGALGWPVAGSVTSGFGMRWGHMHEGIDIAAGTGTPVHAAAGGTVIYAEWMSGYGYLVVIDHGNGLSTAYAHNSELVVGMGDSVGKGFVVALSGSTGHSTGPHVHFEVRLNGAPVDPLGYL